MKMKIREPAVSGRFYPSDKEELTRVLQNLYDRRPEVSPESRGKKLIGGIVPHAGYIYSARHAVPFFDILSLQKPAPETVFIFCPNHYGYGPALALDDNQKWESPMGEVEIDHDFYPHLKLDVAPEAHQVEHAAEVMLPLLQFFMNEPFSIVPISMRDQTPQTAHQLAKKIQMANEKLNKRIAFIASSDFSHYVSPEEGKLLDDKVLEKILQLDSEGVFTTVCQDDISVCGYGPIMTLIELAQLNLSKPEVHILSRGHSGEVFPSSEVVHYISASVTEN